MLAASHPTPDWFGSPQHVVGGFGLAFIVVVAARYFGARTWLAWVLAIGVTCTAEILIEILEYPLIYSGHFHTTAYYDTVSDMTSTVVGGVLGTAVGVLAFRLWNRRRAAV